MPSTTPELVEYGFGLLPGTETFMAMQAEVIHSTHDIININSGIRNCLMQEESNLRFFQHYAYLNCMMECTANYTFKVSAFLLYNSLCSLDVLCRHVIVWLISCQEIRKVCPFVLQQN